MQGLKNLSEVATEVAQEIALQQEEARRVIVFRNDIARSIMNDVVNFSNQTGLFSQAMVEGDAVIVMVRHAKITIRVVGIDDYNLSYEGIDEDGDEAVEARAADQEMMLRRLLTLMQKQR